MECGREVKKRVQAGWSGWRRVSGVICDRRVSVTLEEINSQIALEYGQAITVRVCKADGEVMPIVVVQNATVLDLKKAIRRYVELKQQREGGIQPKYYFWSTRIHLNIQRLRTLDYRPFISQEYLLYYIIVFRKSLRKKLQMTRMLNLTPPWDIQSIFMMLF
uniref:Small nuclear ribonucleoprotein 25 n=1 Tax=Erpetoichthys calabaricus TaxID=27687 RepID=A0A8C4T468_ERPCA